MPSSIFWSLLFFNIFDFPPDRTTFVDLLIRIDQIPSSVFFQFMRLSSTPPILFKVL
jgi:hypothetical protein